MTPQQYLIQRATAAGYDPTHLAAIMQYESGMNPYRWGGTGGNYYGLIQFGPNERQTYGITPDSNFYHQTDAALKFLSDRGYKPGMGLLDMYSTVNAGSPGHYDASDGNGTVSSHVANIQAALPKAQAWLGQTGDTTPQNAPSSPTSASPTSVDSQTLSGGQTPQQGIAGLLGSAMQADAKQKQAQQEAMQKTQQSFQQNANSFFQQALAQNQPRPQQAGILGWS